MNFSEFSPQTNLENLTELLSLQGVAVIANVIPSNECNQIKRQVFKYLYKYHNIETSDDFYKKFRPLNGGLIHYYGISLIRPILDLKTDQRVIEPFAHIWKEKELTTSLDGMFISAPAEETNFYFKADKLDFHTDQASNKNEMCCIQSFVNLEETISSDGCLSVLLNSHKYHSEFFQHFNLDTKGKDWFLLKPNHLDWFINEKKCEWKMVMAPKGSMVFWDSRTIHMGTLPRMGSKNWRFLVYVCYTPAKLQTEQDRQLIELAYVQNRLTAHWPYGVRLFNRRQDDLIFNNVDDLTERHRKYLGI